MEANELRIGNIVMVDNPEYHPRLKGIALRVTGMYEDVFKGEKEHVVLLEDVDNRNTYAQFIRFIKPIRLTKDIRERLNLDSVKISGLSLDLFADDSLQLWTDNHSIGEYIETLHHLQNLYFAIIKKELEVKL